MDTFPTSEARAWAIFDDLQCAGAASKKNRPIRIGDSSITYENSIDRKFSLGEIGENWGKLEP